MGVGYGRKVKGSDFYERPLVRRLSQLQRTWSVPAPYSSDPTIAGPRQTNI